MVPQNLVTRLTIASPLGTSRLYATHLGIPNEAAPHDIPTLVVVAGHHGDENAGYALTGIMATYFATTVGRLVVVPQANPEACMHFNRYSALSGGETDMNRCYNLSESHRDYGCPTAVHARALFDAVMGFVSDNPNTIVLDLHETADGHPDRPEGNPGMWAFVETPEQAELGRELGLPTLIKHNPATFTGALSLRGIKAIAVETKQGERFGVRVRLHLAAVHAAAKHVGVMLAYNEKVVDQRLGGS